MDIDIIITMVFFKSFALVGLAILFDYVPVFATGKACAQLPYDLFSLFLPILRLCPSALLNLQWSGERLGRRGETILSGSYSLRNCSAIEGGGKSFPAVSGRLTLKRRIACLVRSFRNSGGINGMEKWAHIIFVRLHLDAPFPKVQSNPENLSCAPFRTEFV